MGIVSDVCRWGVKTVIREVRKHFPKGIPQGGYLRLAYNAVLGRDYPRAVWLLEDVLRVNSQNALAHLNLGIAKLNVTLKSFSLSSSEDLSVIEKSLAHFADFIRIISQEHTRFGLDNLNIYRREIEKAKETREFKRFVDTVKAFIDEAKRILPEEYSYLVFDITPPPTTSSPR